MGRLLLIFCLTAGVICAPLWADAAKSHYKKGRKAERKGRHLEALMHYAQARAARPDSAVYARSADRLRSLAAQAAASHGDIDSARALADSAALAAFHERESPRVAPGFPPVRLLKSPVRLKPENIRQYFDFRGTVKEAYEKVADAFGLRVIFDGGFSGDDEIRLPLEHVSFETAMEALSDAGGGFAVPITEKLFLVAEDTTQKRQQLEPVATATASLPEAMNAEQAQELSQAVQQTLELKRSQLSASRAVVGMRDSVSKVRMAQALYSQLARPPGEVVIEVELIATNRDRQTDLGVTPPTVFPVTNYSTVFNAQAPELDGAGASTQIAVGGGDTVFGVTVGGARLEAKLQRGEGRSLQKFQIRTTDAQQAELKIGERFPIVNSRFEPSVIDDTIQGEIDQGTLRPPVPSFTFEDLGLAVIVTPTIHSAREVTLQIEAEFSLLAGGAVNGVPILANRAFQSQVRLEEGEHAIISGMAVMEERSSRSGLAKLAKIPLLGRFFRRNTRQTNQSDLVLSIRPRIVRLPPAEMAPSLTFRFGPEQRPHPAL